MQIYAFTSLSGAETASNTSVFKTKQRQCRNGGGFAHLSSFVFRLGSALHVTDFATGHRWLYVHGNSLDVLRMQCWWLR